MSIRYLRQTDLYSTRLSWYLCETRPTRAVRGEDFEDISTNHHCYRTLMVTFCDFRYVVCACFIHSEREQSKIIT
jgi:hypothetical protein